MYVKNTMKDDTYYFHQTPRELAHDLIQTIPLVEGDVVYEAFAGEGAFLNSFPDFVKKEHTEIEEGLDYKDFEGEYDWVITNPPFRLETETGRVNAFWYLLDYFTQRARKGVCFLANDYCLSTLTPRRLQLLRDRGFSITNIQVCCVKKWRGRYFFIRVEKTRSPFYQFLPKTY